MKKISVILLILAIILCALDVNNMTIFWLTKLVGMLFIIPFALTSKIKE